MTYSLEATARRLEEIEDPSDEQVWNEAVEFEEPVETALEAARAIAVPRAAGRVAWNDGFPRRPELSLVPQRVEFEGDSEDAEDEAWQEKALCAQTDPEAFFPEKGGSTREAKRICLGCEVKDACLDYALSHDERFGIWGGLSERERRRLTRGII